MRLFEVRWLPLALSYLCCGVVIARGLGEPWDAMWHLHASQWGWPGVLRDVVTSFVVVSTVVALVVAALDTRVAAGVLVVPVLASVFSLVVSAASARWLAAFDGAVVASWCALVFLVRWQQRRLRVRLRHVVPGVAYPSPELLGEVFAARPTERWAPWVVWAAWGVPLVAALVSVVGLVSSVESRHEAVWEMATVTAVSGDVVTVTQAGGRSCELEVWDEHIVGAQVPTLMGEDGWCEITTLGEYQDVTWPLALVWLLVHVEVVVWLLWGRSWSVVDAVVRRGVVARYVGGVSPLRWEGPWALRSVPVGTVTVPWLVEELTVPVVHGGALDGGSSRSVDVVLRVHRVGWSRALRMFLADQAGASEVMRQVPQQWGSIVVVDRAHPTRVVVAYRTGEVFVGRMVDARGLVGVASRR